MRPTSSVILTILSCAVAACGESTSPGGDVTGGGAGSTAGGAAGFGASATGGEAMGGAGGADAVAGSGGSGGTDAAGGGGGASGGPDQGTPDSGVDGGIGSCPPNAIICDDFEKYQDGATDLSPDWIAYTYSGTVQVDTTKPRGGEKSLHLTTEAGMRHYADIIRETRGVELLPLKHYGRLMVWITMIPPFAHWNINMSSGPMVGFPDELAKFAEGGMFGKLMSNYAQRGRVMANGEYLLRGIGPEAGDPGADADCAVAAPNQTIEAGTWVCWEWGFDGTNMEAHLWLDGEPMTEVDAVQSGTQCQGPGFMGRPMSPSYLWEGPEVFDKLLIGWEQYQDTPAQEVWIDDVVVSSERVGCPSP